MKKAIAIDIGGTKIASALVDEGGNLSLEIVQPSDANSREGLFNQVLDSINYIITESGLAESDFGIGIGVPGLVDQEQGIALYQNNICWDVFPLVSRIKQHFPKVKNVVMDNDVYQAAFAEWEILDQKKGTLVYLTVSTGLSCAIIRDGVFMRGEGFAGEIGLFPIQKKKGTIVRLEDLVGGNNLAEKARIELGETSLSTKELFKRYYQQDSKAIEIVEKWIEHLAYAIYQLGSLIDPTYIVLGGSIIKKNAAILPKLLEIIEELVIGPQSGLANRVKISEFESNNGLIGAGFSAIK